MIINGLWQGYFFSHLTDFRYFPLEKNGKVEGHGQNRPNILPFEGDVDG